MSDYEFQCCYCGYQTDGEFGYSPDVCRICGCVDFEKAEEAEKRKAENRAINARDEILEEESRNEM